MRCSLSSHHVMIITLMVLLSIITITDAALSRKQQKLIVRTHNKLRASLPARNMRRMSWDNGLARQAQNLANRCVFRHDRGNYGQNLWKGSPPGNAKWANVMRSWWKEKNDYNLRTMRPIGNRVVGHFTQMAWANTNKIGCAWKNCGRYQLAVCNYFPRGNFIGQAPFQRGRST